MIFTFAKLIKQTTIHSVMHTDTQHVIDFVDDILLNAVKCNASDIHFEIFEVDFFVKFRVNGITHIVYNPAKTIADQVASRIKILAKLNIAEKRLPQDGAIHKQTSGIDIEFRVSTIPTMYGESIVLRVLNSQIGLSQAKSQLIKNENFVKLMQHIENHNGMNIISGPTGSGKTTTLYTILSLIKNDEIKILTCEDPVEYELDGAIQCNVNSKAKFTFATALRSFLRHDPDIILVGEIRDKETAELAIRAALTGHKVFSTIHADGAHGVVPRLIDLGIDKNILSEAISTITSQKLVKKSENHSREAIFDIVFADENFRKNIRNYQV